MRLSARRRCTSSLNCLSRAGPRRATDRRLRQHPPCLCQSGRSLKEGDVDYQQDLDRFLSAWDQVQRDLQVQERLQELADRQGVPVAEIQKMLDNIDSSLRQ